MRPIWHTDTSPDLIDLTSCYSVLVYEEKNSPLPRRAYTDRSPTDYQGYLDKVSSGAIRPVMIYLREHLVHLCWAHDVQEDLSCWSGLWTHPAFRGPESVGLRGDAYRQVINTYREQWGYRYVFINVIATNKGAMRAATTYWGFNLVGTYPGHRPVGGHPADALMYIHESCDDEEGRRLLVDQAHTMAHPVQRIFVPHSQ